MASHITSASKPTPETHINVDNHARDYVHLAPPHWESESPGASKVPIVDPHHTATEGWHAPYLRRRTLTLFIIIFLICIIILQGLVVASDKQIGLGTSQERLHYLWTYGPTAFLTLLASFWARVACQAKLAAPWSRMSRGPGGAKQTVLLDYLSMWLPISIFQAVRNMDFSVVAASANLIIIRVLIVISTALITLSPVQVLRSEVPLVLKSRFAENSTGIRNSPLAYYTLEGLIRFNSTASDGFTSDWAYQLVESMTPKTNHFSATVDGFSAGLDCESAKISLVDSNRAVINKTDYTRVRMTLESAECSMFLPMFGPSAARQIGTPSTFLRFLQGGCNGSTLNEDLYRVGIISSTINYTDMVFAQHVERPAVQDVYNVSSTLIRSTGLICKPTYGVRPIDLIKNDTKTYISIPSESAPRQLNQVRSWDIMTAFFGSFLNLLWTDLQTEYTKTSLIDVRDVQVDVDQPMRAALELSNVTTGLPSVESFFDESSLLHFVQTYYQQYGAIIAHNLLTEVATTPIEGSAWVEQDRLVVRSLAAHLMTGFLILAIGLVFVIWCMTVRQPVLPRSPSSLIGTAALLANSRVFLNSLHGMGAASLDSLRDLMDCWEYETKTENGCFAVHNHQRLPTNDDLEVRGSERHNSHPRTLRPILRIGVYAILIAIIVVLEVTLKISQSDKGLGDAGDETYVHYLWTTIPAVVLTLFGMYFAGVDFDTRALTPYVNLSRGATFETSVGLDLVDRFTLPTIVKEITTKSYAALASTTTVALTSLLTIFTASLFYTTSVPTVFPAALNTKSLIYTGKLESGAVPDGEGILASSLIFLSNLSYPAFTYEDLVFPEVELTGIDSDGSNNHNSSNFMINATVSAMRSHLSCKIYDQSEIQANITLGTNVTRYYRDASHNSTAKYNYLNPLRVVIKGESCNMDPDIGTNLLLGTDVNATSGYFGYGDAAMAGSFVTGCSDFLYMWGSWSRPSEGNTGAVVSASAMGCNESYESVDVSTTFLGPDLRIDPAYPPRPDEATMRAMAIPQEHKDNYIYYRLVPMTGVMNLDTFFTLATTSRYGMPLALLEDPSNAHIVADVIKFHHGIIRAQVASSSYRGSVRPSSTDIPAGISVVGQMNQTTSNPAIVDDTSTRRRVVQDPASTHVIEALLVATLVCSMVGWFLMRNTDVLPRSPTSIASVAALLSDGNLLQYLPAGAEWTGTGDLAGMFDKLAVFCLGWQPSTDACGDRYAICVMPGASQNEKAFSINEERPVQATTPETSPPEHQREESLSGIGYLRVSQRTTLLHRNVSDSSSFHRGEEMEEIPVSPVSSMLPIQTWDDAWDQTSGRHH
ncbi:uncharacterized protein JN550_003492 [Neoarthrinium moseri]|uniref:uncharacterized protein n=1 Tax=Neoarthrinium moseri TaxID=1658444 RepID=UPI001FDBBA70|nr:uncharacterized protein JN550_003492 [Neoarthrinium moseri]KAI1873239.1 hypothetical protein JN550_003492 [Neoarthrinium moseri]